MPERQRNTNHEESASPEYKGKVCENAWIIDADTAITEPLTGNVDDALIASIAEKINIDEQIIMYSSRRNYLWLKENLMDKIGRNIKSGKSFGNIRIYSSHEDRNFEMRLNKQGKVNAFPSDVKGFDPEKYLMGLDKQSINPKTLNIISPRDEDFLKMQTVSKKIQKPVRMFHVGMYENIVDGATHPGMFALGTIASLKSEGK